MSTYPPSQTKDLANSCPTWFPRTPLILVRLRGRFFSRDSGSPSIVWLVLVALCSLVLNDRANATLITYRFSYGLTEGRSTAYGFLNADGVDDRGFLTGITEVSMSVGSLTIRSPMLKVISIFAYGHPTVQIPADGSLKNIGFGFIGEKWNAHNPAFVMTNGPNLNLYGFESEVQWMEDTGDPRSPRLHQNEFNGPGILWSLERVDSRLNVPDSGSSGFLALLGLGSVLFWGKSILSARRFRICKS